MKASGTRCAWCTPRVLTEREAKKPSELFLRILNNCLISSWAHGSRDNCRLKSHGSTAISLDSLEVSAVRGGGDASSRAVGERGHHVLGRSWEI